MDKNSITSEILKDSPVEQQEPLLTFLKICRTDSQWRAFTICQWKQYGVLSYQSRRIWTMTPELKALFNQQENRK